MPVTNVIALPPETVKSLYESNANTNPYTDADAAKLQSVEDNATGDQTGQEIVAAIDAEVGNTSWRGGGAATSASNTIYFTSADKGVIHGTFDTPITGDIILSDTGAVEGGVACIIWSGSSNPNITGGTINVTVGNINSQGIYTIYIHRISGRYNVNIFTEAQDEGDTSAPATPTLVSVTEVTEGDTTPPATPTLVSVTEVTEGDTTPPATPTLISVT